jgi:hypothetical protein
VIRPQGVERSGMAGLRETLGNPWPPLAMRPCIRMMSTTFMMLAKPMYSEKEISYQICIKVGIKNGTIQTRIPLLKKRCWIIQEPAEFRKALQEIVPVAEEAG